MKVYLLKEKKSKEFIWVGDCCSCAEILPAENMHLATMFSSKEEAEQRSTIYDAEVVEADLTLTVDNSQ